jgi:hypothetical protein
MGTQNLDLEYYGGRTLARLEWTHVYLGRWSPSDRRNIDRAVVAAMYDARLNEVVAEYFPGERIESVFRGAQAGPVPGNRVDRAAVHRVVRALALSGVAVLLLPAGVVLADGDHSSDRGLAGYHGSVGGLLYAVVVYSEGTNGIDAFDEPWKNVCASVYHELQEVRTDPDVEVAAHTHNPRRLGWYAPAGGEIAALPLERHGAGAFREVPLADGSGTVPVQLLWSNRDS